MVRIVLSRKLGELRWNQAMLARVTGIRPATISAWFNEDLERISLEHLSLICEALECEVGDILELDTRQYSLLKAKTKKV